MEAICRFVSEGSSNRYATMVLRKFNKNSSLEFPFVKYIDIYSNRIDVDEELNSINNKDVGRYIIRLTNSLFSDIFKRLIKRQLGVGLLEDLKQMGVKFY